MSEIYDFTVVQFTRMLTNTGSIFDKAVEHAERKKYEPGVLLQMRLAPDQYPFLNQIQIACDAAKGCTARLAGQDPPKHEDNETTFKDLRARVQKVLAYLKGFQPSDLQGCETKRIHLPFAAGKYLLGAEYAAQLALPNFYFHLSTAYSILRHAGVDLGKADYLGEVGFRA